MNSVPSDAAQAAVPSTVLTFTLASQSAHRVGAKPDASIDAYRGLVRFLIQIQ